MKMFWRLSQSPTETIDAKLRKELTMLKKTLLTIMLLCAGSAPAFAGVENVRIGVDGLSCPFCTYNIEKRVKTLSGVKRDAQVLTSLKDGMVSFPWKHGVAFDPGPVRKAIRTAGFTPREIFVTVVGNLQISSEQGSRAVLRVVDEEAKVRVSVQVGEKADRQESWKSLNALGGEKKGKLRVRVEGQVRSDGAGASWGVVLQRWAPLDFGAEVIVEVEELACEQCSMRTMRALGELDDVLHAEADYEEDRVHIWSESPSPNLTVFRQRIESLGFKVTHIHKFDAEGQDLDGN